MYQVLLVFCRLKKKKRILFMFQNITQIMKNDSKWRKMELSCSKNLSILSRGITSKHHDDCYCLNFSSFFQNRKGD